MNDEFTEARSIAALYLLKEKLLKDKLMKDKPTQKNNIHGS
jgi:hypothetical protein